MSLLQIRVGDKTLVIGPGSTLEQIEKEIRQEILKDLASRLAPVIAFKHLPTVPEIAENVCYFMDQLRAENRSLKNYQETLEKAIDKYRFSAHDQQWVDNLAAENRQFLLENADLRETLGKERRQFEMDKERTVHRIQELEAEQQRLYDLLKWVDENKPQK
jgi:regulator of replication initiation timing